MNVVNLGDNVANMQKEMTFWRDSDIMEAEEELEALQNPVSLPLPVTKAVGVIDLLSSSPKDSPAPEKSARMFPMAN